MKHVLFAHLLALVCALSWAGVSLAEPADVGLSPPAVSSPVAAPAVALAGTAAPALASAPAAVTAPAAAPAMTPAVTPWYAGLLSDFLACVLQAAGLVVLVLLSYLAMLLKRKWNIDIGVQEESIFRQAIRQAIAYAEEKAAAALKLNPASKYDKLATVLNLLEKQFPGLTREELDQLVHEELKAAGAGASSHLTLLGMSAGETTTTK